MPKQKVFTIVSDADGLPLSVCTVMPDNGRPKALVQFAHGMCEHKGRYLPLLNALAEHGYGCVINDHRGHGASVRNPEDLGYFYKPGAKGLLEDLHQITLCIKAQYPSLPLFLFGHSMGSLAVRCYRRLYDRDIDGLIVCGSPGRNPVVYAGLAMLKCAKAVRGETHISPFFANITTGGYNRSFAAEGHPFAWLSANTENVIAYEKDPLCGFTFTLNGYEALLTLLRDAYDTRTKAQHPDMPVLFISGGDDPCLPDRKGFDDAIARMKAAGYTDVQGKLFPGLRHEIFSEKDPAVKETILNTLDGWLAR